MPVDKETLKTEIRKLNDKDFESFVGFPASYLEAGEAWANVMFLYGSKVVPPSLTVNEAKQAFKATLLSIPNPIIGLPVAVTAFNATLAGGMAPAFIGTPPTTSVNIINATIAGSAGASGEVVADLIATAIDTNFRTGIATPSGGGSPIPWN